MECAFPPSFQVFLTLGKVIQLSFVIKPERNYNEHELYNGLATRRKKYVALLGPFATWS